MIHSCPDCGIEHSEPEPVVVEEAPDTEPVADAAVEVARIEADRDVTIAKISTRVTDEDTAAQLAAQAARIEVLESALAATQPQEEAPDVVVVADPEPAPQEETPAITEMESSPEPASHSRKSGHASAWGF